LPREAGSNYWQDFDFPTLALVQDRLPGQHTIFPTETRWKYSNLALAVAGEVVAAVSGESFAEYVEAHILTPLGMESTSVIFPDADRARLATGYGQRMPDGSRAAMPFVDAVGMAAATGLSSTVADMAKFISWQFRLLAGGEHEVLASNTLREMQRPQWVQPDWKSGWGIGFGITHTDERDLIGHGGGYPGYLTSTLISPQERVGVIVFTNSLDSQPQTVSERVFDWVAPAIVRAAKGESGEAPDPQWASYEGVYRALWSDTQVTVVDGKLRLFSPRLPNPKTDWMTLEPDGERVFTMDGRGAGPLGEQVVFRVGPDGVATGMNVAEGTYERVSYEIPIQRLI
jgi:CubicO group peptidase (beta-lactamase class C family)